MANHLIKKATLELVEGATKEEFDALSERVDNIVASQTADVSGFKIETEIATLQIYGTDTSMSHQFLVPLNSEVLEASYKIGGSAWIFDNVSVGSLETQSVLAITVSAEFEATGENLDAYIKLVYSYPETSNIQELTDIRIGYDGTVYGSAGEAVRRQIGALAYANSGFNADVKAALLNLLSKVAFIDENGQQYYTELVNAMNNALGVLSITAVFNQGQNVIYDTDSLNDLKQYLTVTAFYEDGTSGEVTAYTLSGTLESGTSTITVSYGGKTATFDVIVTTAVLYSISDYTLNMTAINTELQLFDVDRDWSVAYDVNITSNPATGNGSNFVLFSTTDEPAEGYAVAFKKGVTDNTKFVVIFFGDYTGSTYIGTVGTGKHRFVITHKNGSGKIDVAYRKDNNAVERISTTGTYAYSSKTMRLGLGTTDRVIPAGTLNSVTVYIRELSSAQIDAFLGLGGD